MKTKLQKPDLGTASTPEELPRLDNSLFAQAIKELKSSLRESIDDRRALKWLNNFKGIDKQHIEDVETVITDLQKAIKVLDQLKCLVKLFNESGQLDHFQNTTLYTLGLLVKEGQ